MISIVLIGPEHAGNIGSVARVMANFDIEHLILIRPKAKHLSEESRDRAVHAQKILTHAKIADYSVLKKFDYVIGTASDLGSYKNIPRCPVLPHELAIRLAEIDSKKTKIALVFGRETTGLTNAELALCDFLVTIPTSKKYPSMNLSHAVSVVLYEIFRHAGKEHNASNFIPASEKEKEVILHMLDCALSQMHFASPLKRATQVMVWKRIIGKAMLTKKRHLPYWDFFAKSEKRTDGPTGN